MKKRSYVLPVLCCFLFGVFIFSCSKSQPDISSEWSRYFPLQIGNEWYYSTKKNDKDNAGRLFKITGAEKVGKHQTFIIGIFDGGEIIQNEFYSMTADSLVSVQRTYPANGKVTVFAPPEPLLKFPLEEGTEWEWEASDAGKFQGKTVFRVAREEPVSTNAGNFKTLRVDMFGETPGKNEFLKVHIRKWFARDVGMVKFEYNYTNSSIIGVLEKYVINGNRFP